MRGDLGIPLLGAWVADVVLALPNVLPSSVTLTLGNLKLAGAVYRQAQFAGQTTARLVGGAGGWSQAVQSRAYNNPAGVLVSTVLSDAATEVGESVVVATDSSLGTFFVRFADKASRVLGDLAGPLWWVDSSGVTHVGSRPGGSIGTPFQVINFDGARGIATVATEDPASWLPGTTFSNNVLSTQTIASVRHELAGDGVARMQVTVQ